MFALACVLPFVGCRPQEEIRTYTVDRPEQPPAAQTGAEPSTDSPAGVSQSTGEPTHRMLAAMLPGESKAWFLKAVAPIEAVDGAADAIRNFYRSVTVENGRPQWELPAGWTEEPGGQMRLATLRVPSPSESGEGDPIEISVIGLPLVDDWPVQVLGNTNRWLGQLGLAPVVPSALDEVAVPLGGAAERAVLVEANGSFDAGGMTPPFASAAAKAPPISATRPIFAAQSAGETLAFDRPEAWADKPGSAMRKASLAAGDAEVTAFVFPATGAMGDPLENINRWRGEVGLAATTQEDLDTETEAIEIAGSPATYAQLVGPDQTTLAAMTQRGESVWFFKLRGPNATADAERERFREWLESIRFE
ncbi:hypothetical protein Mal64_00570 [Pseudobythopirellula maris]|uniref:Uncharacterized protein n=1 Tax=Pseudobythopirellula maris TaxID=2527991 RepID=A0A5C5ZRJ6_9BACT|nr:hypothetical protein [Pseudobythopirellula maris]TWT89678.1 hypothetical protein Mal64_00570 [Pseudobythopirellula maris]